MAAVYPEPIKDWSLTSLKEKLVKIGREGRERRAACRVPAGRGRHTQAPVRSSFATESRYIKPGNGVTKG